MNLSTTVFAFSCAEPRHLPLKSIDGFEITSASSPEEPVDLLTLGQLHCLNEGALLSGVLSGSESDIVSCEPIVDWAVDKYEGIFFPWAITKKAWYKLEGPSPRYADMFSNVLLGIEIIRRCWDTVEFDNEVEIKELVDTVAGSLRSVEGTRRRAATPLYVKKFAVGYLESCAGKRIVLTDDKKRKTRFRSSSKFDFDEISGMESISDDDMPRDFHVKDMGEDMDDDEVYHARKRAWRKVKYQRRKEEEERRLEQIEAEVHEREKAESEARGPPPPMCTSFRLSQDLIGEVLFIWSVLQEFGDIFQISPFSLDAFEASLQPGPSVRMIDRDMHQEAPTEQTNPKPDVEIEVQTLRKDHPTDETHNVDNGKKDESIIDQGMDGIKGRNETKKIAKQQEQDSVVDDAEQKEKHEDWEIPAEQNGYRETNGSFENEGVPETKFEEGKAQDQPITDVGLGENKTALEHIALEKVVPVPVKRGRGRPRKDGSAPKPSTIIKKAPQNIVLDPTIKTRRQKGIKVQVKKEYWDEEIEDGDMDVEYSVSESENKVNSQKIKIRKKSVSMSNAEPSENKISMALSAAQAAKDSLESKLRERYGLSSHIISMISPVDKAYAASGILLRDIVLRLISAIDGTLPTTKKDGRPSAASISWSGQIATPWPVLAANTVWSWPMSSPEARHAALRLAYGDFINLNPMERILIISSLVYEALESPIISSEINSRMEKYQNAPSKLFLDNVKTLYDSDQCISILRGNIDKMLSEEMVSQAAKPLKEWNAWCSSLGLHMKTYIGEDFYGRRYWALGGDAGAFRIFCQNISERNNPVCRETWGWYEGDSIDHLMAWMRKANIRNEAKLVAALGAAPLASPSRLSEKEMCALRTDGYRGLNYPLLRGEWNLEQDDQLVLPIEYRASQALESILGTIPFWFKVCLVSGQFFVTFVSYFIQHILQGDGVSKSIFGISDLVLSGQTSDAARALIMAEHMLRQEQKLTEEWQDVWGHNWRLTVAASTDLKDISLQIAALQSHVKMEADVIPRGTFLKILDDLNCLLMIPSASHEIAVMRTGLIQHIDKALQLLRVSEISIEDKSGKFPSPKIEVGSSQAGHRDHEDESAMGSDTARAIPNTILPLKVSFRDQVREQWTAIRERVLSLNPVSRYTVRGIVYRRHLSDSYMADFDGLSAEEAAVRQRPVAWMYLVPAKTGPPEELPSQSISVPIVLDPGLEDYIVPIKDYVQQRRIQWRSDDRFKMFIPPRPFQKQSKSAGVWRKGAVLQVLGADGTKGETVKDPWESLLVEFDSTPIRRTEQVSPWKIEIDPEEQLKIEEEAKKVQQAVARAQRARSSVRSIDEVEAFAQEAEWAEEDMRLEMALKQAHRAEELLSIYNFKDLDEPSDVHNVAFHGPEAVESYKAYLEDLGLSIYTTNAAAAATQNKLKSGKSVARNGAQNPAASQIPTGPLFPGQQVPENVLEAFRSLSRDQFITMLTNFYVGLKGKFKIPIFAHKELDLYTVWWAVMERGGYETVTNEKLWKDICRCLRLDLSGQTSASYNMRLNYERCLLDFENYLACGQYEADLAADKAPLHTHLMNADAVRFKIPGAYEDNTPVSRTVSSPISQHSGPATVAASIPHKVSEENFEVCGYIRLQCISVVT